MDEKLTFNLIVVVFGVKKLPIILPRGGGGGGGGDVLYLHLEVPLIYL